MEDEDDEPSHLIIVDCGTSGWKGGFSDDEGPSAIVDGPGSRPAGASPPPKPPRADAWAAPPAPPRAASSSCWTELFEQLEVEAGDCAVLLAEPAGASSAEREQVAQLLFGRLGVRALFVAPQPLLALYGTDHTTGIVVDVGERATSIWPVFEGHPVLGACVSLPLGSGAVTSWLADQLPALGHTPASRADGLRLARQLKEKACRVAADYQRELRQARRAPPTEVTLADGDGGELKLSVSDEVRLRAGERLFRPALLFADGGEGGEGGGGGGGGGDGAGGGAHARVGVHEAVARAVRQCDASIRPQLVAAVVLVGGGSLLSGFAERLQSELERALAPPPPPKSRGGTSGAADASFGGARAAVRGAVCVEARGDRRYAAWLGGTVLSKMSACHRNFAKKSEHVWVGRGGVPALPARAIEALEAEGSAAAADEERRRRGDEQEAARHARGVAEEARAWWVEQAPHAGAEARRRQRALFEGAVAPFYDRVLATGGGRGCGAMSAGCMAAAAAGLLALALAKPQGATTGADAAGKQEEAEEEEEEAGSARARHRVRRLLLAGWCAHVADAPETQALGRTHADGASQAVLWRRWRHIAAAARARERTCRDATAACGVRRTRAALRRWVVCSARDGTASELRLRVEAATAAVALARWKRRLAQTWLLGATGRIGAVGRLLACWRAVSALGRWRLRRRRGAVLGAQAELHRLRHGAWRGWRAWWRATVEVAALATLCRRAGAGDAAGLPLLQEWLACAPHRRPALARAHLFAARRAKRRALRVWSAGVRRGIVRPSFFCRWAGGGQKQKRGLGHSPSSPVLRTGTQMPLHPLVHSRVNGGPGLRRSHSFG